MNWDIEEDQSGGFSIGDGQAVVIFKEVSDHYWIFEFSNANDKAFVLSGRPWLFDQHLLVLHEFNGFTPPSQMDFTHSLFWVQLHELP